MTQLTGRFDWVLKCEALALGYEVGADRLMYLEADAFVGRWDDAGFW